ncbi:aldehyde dehydrogenase family protein [Sphingorhabdus sp. SMR4y]|uniref:aldehyde dehydrogenase family protein n=1 Tax=Sphingorhabdus sp. SMR4y TaxID=2584094 RepID=UPI000B5CF646|nr:aldehyde dehydrogenase family protein [Sphingorhabdus sp. SMR4y]ASK88857.1 NAD-dependent succinate-semialdehyde dehydrogenase [Sphingorhabdus sp. SMR4y]
MKVRNPRTGETDYEFTPVDGAGVAAAAHRLRRHQPAWAAMPVSQRSAILLRWADAIEKHAGAIIQQLTIDTGRAGIAAIEVGGVPGTIRRWAEIAPEIIARHSPTDIPSANPTVVNTTRLVPFPLFGAIAPWNFPMTLSTIDAIPALFAGCAALIKPSEITPRFVEPLRASIAEVPELAHVLEIVVGDAATGQALVANVDYVCFTGSVATGRKVAIAAAEAFIPANLELGGKDPMIILASADPVEAAKTALRASILATGQACQSIERLYVARPIYDKFLETLVDEAERVRLNYPDIHQGEIGPFIFAPQGEKIAEQIAEAREKGARVLAGGTVEILGGGTYLRPTVIADVRADMAIIRDESFGPVLPVIPFDAVEDAIAQANDSIYGLSAAVLAGNAEEAEAVGRQLEAGAISINDGSMTAMVWDAENSSFKMSGMGPSRMGESGLTRFFRKQALIRQTASPARIQDFAEENFAGADRP